MHGTGWCINLRADIAAHRGGANDGIFHPGIREIRVIAQKDGILAPTGALQFDTLRLHNSMADAYSQEVSLAFPTGSFRAPPSDSIARTSDILDGVKTNRSATAAAAGFSYTRTDLQWANVEAKPGVYNWAAHDRIVQQAQTSGIGTLFVLGLGHPVYTGGLMTPPRTEQQLDAFARYVQAAAGHFKGQASGVRDLERTQLRHLLAADAIHSGIWQIAEARDRRHPQCRPGCDDHHGGAERLGQHHSGNTLPN